MNQLIAFLALPGAVLCMCLACVSTPNCQDLSGHWTNREGQDFIFQPGGKSFWLVKFGSSFDTSIFSYNVDCHKKPAAIDLTNFKSGPYAGKTLFGILEWSSDSSFRLRYESGMQPDVRPKAFENEQTQQFFRK